jgi:hypothetical protein
MNEDLGDGRSGTLRAGGAARQSPVISKGYSTTKGWGG